MDNVENIVSLEEYSVTYKPGIYFLGDPCYVIQGTELWDKACEDSGEFRAFNEFAIAPTMYGDGVYYDKYSGKEFGVDSASLGIVNLKYYHENENVAYPLEELGAVIEVNDYVKFTYDPDEYSFAFEIDGAAVFIPTNDENDEDEIDNSDNEE